MDTELRYVCESCGEVAFISELPPVECSNCSSVEFLNRAPTLESDREIMDDFEVSCPECGMCRSVNQINGRTNDWMCLEEFGGCGAIELAEKDPSLVRPDDLSDDQNVKLAAFRRVRGAEDGEFSYRY